MANSYEQILTNPNSSEKINYSSKHIANSSKQILILPKKNCNSSKQITYSSKQSQFVKANNLFIPFNSSIVGTNPHLPEQKANPNSNKYLLFLNIFFIWPFHPTVTT